MKKPANYFHYFNRSDHAVSEVIGAVLLLGIVITIFVVIYSVVLAYPFGTSSPTPVIIGTVVGNNIVIEHRSGDQLSLDTKIKIDIANQSVTKTVGELLQDSNGDGHWNVGEKLLYPFNYKLNQTNADAIAVDIAGNRLVLYGNLNITPKDDLGVKITVDNINPKVFDIIHIKITVTNYRGDMDATGIIIKYKMNDALKYISYSPASYNYNVSLGLWTIKEPLGIRQSISLTIEAQVLETQTLNESTQIAMVLDGSGSISSSDFTMMKTGLANAIKNTNVFPHDGTAELTVIQFGDVDPSYALVEVGPVLVNNLNYQQIANQILGISQMVDESHSGATPTGCGIGLAADQLHNSGYFDVNKRQIINLVTDGVANCNWTQGIYTGDWQGWDGWLKGNDQHHTGNYSAKSYNPGSARYGDITCNDLDTTGASSITVDFWYRLQNTQSSDLQLYFYNGNSYDNIISLGGNSKNTWLHYTNTINNQKYFKTNFKIRFNSQLGSNADVWIDDVIIKTNKKELLNDSFESSYWAENWWNPGIKGAEEAQSYLVNTLQMTADKDEFDCLGVGVGGMYGGPDVDWLKNKIVWPQPGNIAPPYKAGWVKTITTWQDFGTAINQILWAQFTGIENKVSIIGYDPKDPNQNPDNNFASLIIVPHG